MNWDGDKLKSLTKYIEDILIFLGIFLITIATYLISFVASLFVLGGFLLLLGIYFSINPPKVKRG